ncbi:MAG TPA: YoaK family protein [Stellaceae bacterium]|nr:YoaK family protein [Stellaceae bacterium]
MWRVGLLCVVAGYVDGFGYFALGHVFAANMTGNTVLFAAAAGQGDWERATRYGVTLGAFIVGSLAAAVLKRILRRHFMPLFMEAAVLALTYLPLAGELPALVLLAIAMGLQGAAITRSGAVSAQTIVLTSTIIRFTEGAIDWVFPREETGENTAAATTRVSALAWTAYAFGAGIGVAAIKVMRNPLIAPILALLLLAIEMMVAGRPRPRAA